MGEAGTWATASGMNPPPFRSVEISDPRFETDGLRQVTVKSEALGGRGDVTVFVPPGVAAGRRPAPLVILLHGVYGSHWAWTGRAGAHRTAARMVASGEIPPLVLAMPGDGLAGDGTGYLRQARADYERWIIEDVPRAAALAAPAVDPGAPFCLGGLSMGGFGAMRLGARHGDRIRAVSGLSSVTALAQLRDFVAEDLGAAGADVAGETVLEAWRRAGRRPALRFDCGTGDPLLAGNRALHAGLLAAGIPHTYLEHPGGHTWEYWEEHLPETLRFFGECLRDGGEGPGR